MAAATTDRPVYRVTKKQLHEQPPPPRSMGCAGCGDCCDPVILSREVYMKLRVGVRAHAADVEWARALTRHPDHHRQLIASLGNDGIAFTCPHFDAEARLCGAHDARPPICRGFPWYGGEPGSTQSYVGGRCSFRWDLPAPRTAEPGVRPLLPLWPKE